MVKNLLITFDYELFLGSRSGIPEDCMLRPTRKVAEILKRHKSKGVFFVDTTYLLALKNNKSSAQSEKDLQQIGEQLNQLADDGHSIFPHLHPHWLDARYDSTTNNWKLTSVKRYRYTKLTPEERMRVFTDSIALLREILGARYPNIQIDGFRAGGWSIQPFADFIPAFEANSIRYDFSVFRGFYQFTDAQYFDFTNAPEQFIYKFNDDVCQAAADGKYTEITIDSVKIPGHIQQLDKLWLKFVHKALKDHSFDRGAGQPSHNLKGVHPLNATGFHPDHAPTERIAIELLTSLKLPYYLRHLKNNDQMHFISHPKMILDHNLSVFSKFMDQAHQKFELETDFRKMVLQN